MATKGPSFTAQLRGIEKKNAAKLTAIMRQSAQEVANAASTPQPSVKQTGGSFEIGKVPVDTGVLRNSQVTSINGGGAAQGPNAAPSVIGIAQLGSIINVRWTAEYARAIDKGTARIRARLFVTYHTERWAAIVGRIAGRLASRTGAAKP